MDFFGIFKSKNNEVVAVPEVKVVKPKTKEQAIADIHATTLTVERFNSEMDYGSIEVTEMISQFPDGVEDAAMLYANGRTVDAVNTTKALLQSVPSEEIYWFLLFNLYEANQQKQDFEQLALEYVQQFEKSPPGWRACVEVYLVKRVDAQQTQDTQGQLFSLKGCLDRQMTERIGLLQEAASKGAIQLDLSGIADVTPEGAQLLQMALAKLQKQQANLQIASGAFVSLLQHYTQQPDSASTEPWLLLLQLYQLQGKQTEFEDLAVEFAVHFELSPPSWEAPKQAVVVIAAALVADKSLEKRAAFRMSGTINSASAAVFEAFKQYALKQGDEVKLDMHDVDRIEFASVSLFMDSFMALIPLGKQVVIIDANMMVRVLLTTMGVDQMATIVPRKC